MTLTQTVEIPADRRLHLDLEVPREVPTGQTDVVIQFPVRGTEVKYTNASSEEVMAAGDEILDKHLSAFEALAK